MVLTEPSTDALSLLYSIEYNKDYPQIQIIFKKPQTALIIENPLWLLKDNILV